MDRYRYLLCVPEDSILLSSEIERERERGVKVGK